MALETSRLTLIPAMSTYLRVHVKLCSQPAKSAFDASSVFEHLPISLRSHLGFTYYLPDMRYVHLLAHAVKRLHTDLNF